MRIRSVVVCSLTTTFTCRPLFSAFTFLLHRTGVKGTTTLPAKRIVEEEEEEEEYSFTESLTERNDNDTNTGRRL